MLDLDTIKMHIRVTHSLEDPIIEDYIEWAKSTVIESVTTEDNADLDYLESNMQFKKAVVMLTSFFYEQRMPIGEVRTEELPYTVLDSIQKLRGNPKVVKGDSDE